MAEKEYQKLPGRGMRSTGWISVSRNLCSLYLAKDHLLQIDSVGGYTEEYKRFYFRDIQAITIRKTQSAAMTLSFTGVFALISALIGGGIGDSVFSGIFYVIAACLFLIFVVQGVLFAFRGGSCISYLKTAVQTEQLPSLKRIRTATKVLAKIQPCIEQAQGSLTGEELKQEVENYLQRPPEPPVIAGGWSANKQVAQPALTKAYGGAFHAALFLLLLVAGLMNLLHIFFHPVWFVAFETIFAMALFFVVVTALVKQSGTDLSGGVRKVTQITLGYLCVSSLFGYILGSVMTATNPETAGNQWAIIEVYSQFDPLETMWLLIVLVISALLSVILGTVGLLLLKRWRSRKAAESVSSAPLVDQPIL